MKTRKTLVALACLSSLVALPTFAQEAGSMVGRLTNTDQNVAYVGAQITLVELNLNAVSTRDGSFRFQNVPAGTYTMRVRYLGAATITQTIEIKEGEVFTPVIVMSPARDDIDTILVRGQRSGQASAINQQRVADNIASIVSSDAIGQFPDQNAAEALQRLPGLSIERDQGEGRFVGIRGIDPNLNNVTINGLNIPSPEGGVRSVALDVIPSELIQTLAVSKSVTPDMDADAIGGAIEVRSVSAFDQQDDTASLTIQASQNDLRDDTSPKVSASMTHKLTQNLGIAAAISYFDRDFGSDNIESNGDDELEQRYYDISRERIGGALNIDYRPDFNNQYFIRTLFSRFTDDEFRLANTFAFDGEDSEIERASKDREESQTIFTIAAGAEHQRKDWLIEYQVGYAKSDEDEPDALYFDFVTENASINANLNTRIPSITQDNDALDLSNYELDEIAFEDNITEDEEVSLKIDFTKTLNHNRFSGLIKFGAKYRNREKFATSNIAIFDGDFDGIDPSQFSANSPQWAIGDFGPGLNRNGLRDFFNNQRTNLELDDLNSDLESNGASYISEEDIFAAYAMTTIDFDKLRITAGLRYERTDFSTQGNRVELIENEETDIEEVVNTPWANERDYDHLFPSVNLRYEFSDKLIARAAYTQTLSRPGFEDAAAVQIIESTTEEDDGMFVTEREAEVGNPSLEPYEADNFDLTLEYYPGDIGVLSAGYFYKQIDNFVISADVANTPDWEGFEEVIQPINGETADLHGIELAWVKNFDNGLILGANATFSDSEATTFLDGERFETSLPNQSDTIGNLMLGYENSKVSLRLTMTHKSKNLEEIDGDLIRYEDEHQQVDFTAKYYLNNDIVIFFNGINLSDEPFYNYFDERNTNAQFEEYGRTFELGFSWQIQ